MKKLLAVCSFCVLVAGCAHQGAGYGNAGGFAPLFRPECIVDSAYSLGPTYGPSYGYAAGAWDEGLCRNGGRHIHSYSSPEVASAIAQRASVVGHTRSRPDPRVITRPASDASPGASSSVAQGSGFGSGFAGPGPSAPASPAPAPSVSSSPVSRPAPHSN